MDAYGSCHCVGHYEFQVSLELLEVDSETGVWIIVASGTEALSLSLKFLGFAATCHVALTDSAPPSFGSPFILMRQDGNVGGS